MPSLLLAFFCLLLIIGKTAAHAQGYPAKTVRIVTADAGGGADLLARILAQGLSTELGQPVVVENRPAGVIPMDLVAKAAPDGYTLLVYSNSMWIIPLIQSVSYDPIRDFVPVTLIGSAPNILVVSPSLPVNSVQDLINLAKSKPGQLNYASADAGSSIQIAADLFRLMAGTDMVAIPYRGGGPAVTGLLRGEVQLMFAAAGSVAPQLKSGLLKGIAVTSSEPSQLFPGLPAIAATVPGYESVGTYGLFAPAKTAPAIVDRLNAASARVLGAAETKGRLAAFGVEAASSSPDQLSALVKSEIPRLSPVLKQIAAGGGN